MTLAGRNCRITSALVSRCWVTALVAKRERPAAGASGRRSWSAGCGPPAALGEIERLQGRERLDGAFEEAAAGRVVAGLSQLERRVEAGRPEGAEEDLADVIGGRAPWDVGAAAKGEGARRPGEGERQEN